MLKFSTIGRLVALTLWGYSSAALAVVHVAPNDPKVRYTGRFDFGNPLQPRFNAPGASISISVSGTTSVTFLMSNNYGNNKPGSPSFWPIIDGVVNSADPSAIRWFGAASISMTVSGLSLATHTIEFYHRTEGWQGINTFLGFDFPDGTSVLNLPARPARRMLFFGDSYTAGDGSNPIEDTGPSCAQTSNLSRDNYVTWGAVAARAFCAEYSAVAMSGWGVGHNGGDCVIPSTYTVPSYYPYAYIASNFPPTPSGPLWPASNYVPHVVGMYFGLNDFTSNSCNASMISQAQFESAYLNFVNVIRADYPSANIFLGAKSNDGFKSYVNNVVTAAADPLVRYIEFDALVPGPLGCSGHPNAAQHQLMANSFVSAVQTSVGWTLGCVVGTTTDTPTISPTFSVSPTYTVSPFVTATSTFSISPTFSVSPTPSPTAAGPCLSTLYDGESATTDQAYGYSQAMPAADGTTLTEDTMIFHAGSKSLQAHFLWASGGWSGIQWNWANFNPARAVNGASYSGIELWIRSSAGTLNSINLNLKDSSGTSSNTINVNSYLPSGVTTTWQKLSVPLADFNGYNVNSIWEIDVQTGGSSAGDQTIYLDDFGFTAVCSSPTPSPPVTASHTVTFAVSPTLTITLSNTATASPTPFSTASASVTQSSTMSPAQSATETTLTTQTASPTASSSPSPSQSPTLVLSATPSPSLTPTVTRTSTSIVTATGTPTSGLTGNPGGSGNGGGRPLPVLVLSVPNPQSGPALKFSVQLEGVADSLVFKVYTKGHTLVRNQTQIGPWPAGWNTVTLVPEGEALSSGLYYLQVIGRLDTGMEVKAKSLAKFYYTAP